MATERIEIIVTERGTREVNRRITRVGATAAASARGVDLLRRSLLFIGGVALIRGLVRTADTFTLIQNRLKVVTSSTQELNHVTEELFGIAQRTRASFKATAEVYARAARAVETLGVSQKETLQFTETLNQAVILSGASTAEAAGGLIQLSQALASSRLSGDEFRSVSEQLPVVLKIIAKELGVNIGQLRKLGQEGQLTADVVLRAFKNAREEIATEFAKTIPTIGQSFVILQNALIKFIGRMNESTLVGKALSLTVIGLANNFDTFGRSVLVVTTILGVAFARTAINAAINGLRALRLALVATGFGALPVIIATIITSLVFFSDKIKIASDTTATLADVAVEAFFLIKEGLMQIFESLEPALAIVKGFLGQFVKDFDFNFETVLRFTAFVVDKIIAFFHGMFAAVKTIFDNFGAVLSFSLVKGVETALNAAAAVINEFITQYNEFNGLLPDLGLIKQLTIDAPAAAAEAGALVATNFQKAFEANGGFAQQLTEEVITNARARAKKREEENAPFEQETQGAAETFNSGFSAALTARESASVDQLQVALQVFDDIKGPQALFKQQLLAINQLFADGRITAGEYGIAMANLKAETLEFGTTAADGFHRGMARIKADILDVASVAENALTNAFGAAEDAFVSFVQTGKFDFSGLVDSILADLTKLLARQAISGLINSFAGGGAGGAGGGVVGILGSLFGGARAAGGPVTPDKAFLVGEKGPELFTPQGRGNITPNSDLRGAAMAPPVVNVNVINVTDPNDVAAAINDGSADKAIINSVGRNKDAVKQNLEG